MYYNLDGTWDDVGDAEIIVLPLDYTIQWREKSSKWQAERDAALAGKTIQRRGFAGWHDWPEAKKAAADNHDHWDNPWFEFRIKPPVVKQCYVMLDEADHPVMHTIHHGSTNLKLTFEDGKLVAAEVLK